MSFKKYVELKEMAVASFGKHQGKHINDIDSGYATWLLKSIKDSGKVLGNFLADDGSGKLSKDQIIQALEIRSRNNTVAPTSTNEPIRASGSVPKAPKDDFFLDPSMKEYWLSRYSPYHRLLFDIMKELYQTMEKESSKLPNKSNFPQYFIENGFDLTELLSRLNPNDKNYEPNEVKRKEYKRAYDLITKRNTGESSYVDVYRDGRSPDQWNPESSSTRTPTTLKVASRRDALMSWKEALAQLGKNTNTKFNGSNPDYQFAEWEKQLAKRGLKLPDIDDGEMLADWLYDTTGGFRG